MCSPRIVSALSAPGYRQVRAYAAILIAMTFFNPPAALGPLPAPALATSDRPQAPAAPLPAPTRAAVLPAAIRVRRWAIILAALFSGLLVFVSMLVDPAPDSTGAALIEAYAGHPVRQGIHTNLIHYGFALFAPVAFALVGLVCGRGAWLAKGAGLLPTIGLTTQPRRVLVDFHDVAVANLAGIDAAVAASDAVGALPGFLPLLLPALICSMIALPLAAAAAWRARLLPGWAPLALIVALGALRLLPGQIGFALLALATTGLAYALTRISPERWFSAPRTTP
jgi:hypothetical protein